jgi:putative hydrolase of the HAD superfamily
VVFLIDLDGTLYPLSSGLFDAANRLIIEFMVERLGMTPDEADAVRKGYLAVYGTTLRGLILEHQVDADEYMRFVHSSNARDYLRPNPALDLALGRLNGQKYVFSNAPRFYCEEVLDALGVRRHFGAIFDNDYFDGFGKPERDAFEKVLAAVSAAPEDAVIVDDLIRNVRVGKEMGMTTVLVREEGDVAPHEAAVVDFMVRLIEEIGDIDRFTVEP